jgi:hypothetical protein
MNSLIWRCPGVSQNLFKGVLEVYKEHVVSAVQVVLKKNMEEAIKLGNFMLPELRTTLARQRRDYNLSEGFEPQFPIAELSNIFFPSTPLKVKKAKHSGQK